MVSVLDAHDAGVTGQGAEQVGVHVNTARHGRVRVDDEGNGGRVGNILKESLEGVVGHGAGVVGRGEHENVVGALGSGVNGQLDGLLGGLGADGAGDDETRGVGQGGTRDSGLGTADELQSQSLS